jgi:hypothetical protein
MLPLLPALILLLLQGPAGIERMAGAGQLPGALDALHRQIANAPQKVRAADEVVLASLLAASGDQAMSQALLRLLAMITPEVPAEARRIILLEEVSPPVPIPVSLGSPRDGYLACRRSRDGPAGIAGSPDF